jgi:hypothetical protein
MGRRHDKPSKIGFPIWVIVDDADGKWLGSCGIEICFDHVIQTFGPSFGKAVLTMSLLGDRMYVIFVT